MQTKCVPPKCPVGKVESELERNLKHKGTPGPGVNREVVSLLPCGPGILFV